MLALRGARKLLGCRKAMPMFSVQRLVHPSLRTAARLVFPSCTVSRPCQRWAYGHRGWNTPRSQPAPHLGPNVSKHRAATQLGPWFMQREALLTQGLLEHLPVSTVVFYLQQGLFSKSSLKWLCLSSLLLYELKKTSTKREINQTPTTINTKTLTHQTLAACVTHKPHQYSVKKLILLRTIHSTRDLKSGSRVRARCLRQGGPQSGAS